MKKTFYTNGKERSWAEISLRRIENNYLAYKSRIHTDCEIMAVVKANAYGHGALEVAGALSGLGVRRYATATLAEAVELRRGGIEGEILVLGYTSPELADIIYEHDITQAIISEEYAASLIGRTKRKIKCHIALNTGMNRIGVSVIDPLYVREFINFCAERLCVTGVLTHLSAAASGEREDIDFTLRQIERFESAVGTKRGELFFHCLNSAGGILYSDIIRGTPIGVRLGIMLYGLTPTAELNMPGEILPSLSWKSRLTHIFSVNRGERIGYGRGYTAQTAMKVGTVSVGYADGYRRVLSNRADVLIHGKRAKILGNICMDQLMVDLSDIDASFGEEVVLIGSSGTEKICAEELASHSDTIGYEILTGISDRVERIYI